MFERVEKLIGKENLDLIGSKRIVVVGLGGVGGYAVEALVRSGVKQLILVDYDTISVSNLNRQIITTQDNLGFHKVDEMKKRILTICPDCQVTTLDLKLNLENIDLLFSYSFDYLIDACDTILVKEELIRRCLEHEIGIISSMGTGNKLHPMELKVMDIWDTSYDPIAKRIRKYLREHHISKKVTVVCSKEVCETFQGSIPSMIFVPAVSGLLCANYIILDIIGQNS